MNMERPTEVAPNILGIKALKSPFSVLAGFRPESEPPYVSVITISASPFLQGACAQVFIIFPGFWRRDALTQNASTLVIEGTGIVSGNGFDPTAMDWMFTTQSSGGRTRTQFSFSANGVAVPDGGSAIALLGLALTGTEILRRRLRST
jgi:hypothetical protein